LVLTDQVHDQIARTIGDMPAEQGGMLGGRRRTGTVTHFAFDGSARCSFATYTPDRATLNQLLREEWNPQDVDLLGFAHSHPTG